MTQGQQQQAQPDFFDNARATANITMFIARTLGCSVVVFLRRNFGERYLGGPAVCVLVAVPLFVTAWPGHDVRPLMWFMPVYLYACFLHRTVILRRKRRGVVVHSFYGGDSLLRRFFPHVSESTMRRGLEPLSALLAGVFLMPLSEPLGSYIMLAAIGLYISECVTDITQREHVQRMHDAYAEQQFYTEQFRRNQGIYA